MSMKKNEERKISNVMISLMFLCCYLKKKSETTVVKKKMVASLPLYVTENVTRLNRQTTRYLNKNTCEILALVNGCLLLGP